MQPPLLIKSHVCPNSEGSDWLANITSIIIQTLLIGASPREYLLGKSIISAPGRNLESQVNDDRGAAAVVEAQLFKFEFENRDEVQSEKVREEVQKRCSREVCPCRWLLFRLWRSHQRLTICRYSCSPASSFVIQNTIHHNCWSCYCMIGIILWEVCCPMTEKFVHVPLQSRVVY